MPFLVGFAATLVAFEAAADVLDDLLPAPVRIERLQGFAAVRPDGGATCVLGEIVGCPRETADEAYVLEVGSDGVRIVAPTEKGERWAKVTLKQLVKLSDGRVPCCRIVDWPRYRYRGFMIDVARNFLEMDELKALVDVMGDYKLNFFHWHLTENNCWRLESKRHPELQGPNGWYDPYGVRHRGRFYTQEEFKELVDYAGARGVTVIPEFDLPGHSVAFRQAFGLKGMDDPRALKISLDLYDELCDLVPAEKMPIVHMGMDEVWDPAEQPSKGMYSAWVKKLKERGRIAANWGGSGPLVIEGAERRMLFGFGDGIAGVHYERAERDAKAANGVEAFVDPKWYIEEDDPFELLCRAAYTAPFSTAAGRKIPGGLKAGAEFCAWHDSAVGLPTANVFRNQQIFPSCVLYGDLFWRGREKDYPEFERRLPLADDHRLDIARDLERRVIVHRDRIFADFKYPFCFLRQTDMRWRLSHADGRLIAKDIAQATVFPFRKKDKPLNYVDEDCGDVVMETWIRSPKDQKIGAWIGFTAYDRDHGRGRAHGTCGQGEWNNVGASVTVNGEKIMPPVWENPNLPDEGTNWVKFIKYQYPSDEIPFRNEEYYMREPTKVRLHAGWNHVKLRLPMPHAVNWIWRRQWVGTFIPVAGTTDHPREVEGLEYSSEAPRPRRDLVTVRPVATKGALVNPGMGWVFYHHDNGNWLYGAETPIGDTLDWFPGVSTVYFRIPWCELEPEEGRFRWDVIDSVAQPWIAAGKRIAFRFTCSESGYARAVPEWVEKAGAKGSFYSFKGTDDRLWEPDYLDPIFFEKFGNFLAAAAKRWDGREEVAFVDVGSFGMWGEGHTGYTSRLSKEKTAEVARAHAELHRRHFRRSPVVISDDVAGPSCRDADHPTMAEMRKLGIGFRDDSIMVGARPNQWYHAGWARKFAEAGLPVVVESAHFYKDRRDPRTGEQCWYEGGLLESTVAYRANYQGIHWWPDDFLTANRGEVEAVNRRLGYRFELREATWPREVAVGGEFGIDAEWVNVGVTVPQEEAFVSWSLLDESGKVCWTCVDETTDFRSLRPTLEDGEHPTKLTSLVRFGWDRAGGVVKSASRFARHDGRPLPPSDRVPSVTPGTYTLAVSVGRRDATPRIALPVNGQVGTTRRYVVGRVELVFPEISR